jgi:hypothetical protein
MDLCGDRTLGETMLLAPGQERFRRRCTSHQPGAEVLNNGMGHGVGYHDGCGPSAPTLAWRPITCETNSSSRSARAFGAG